MTNSHQAGQAGSSELDEIDVTPEMIEAAMDYWETYGPGYSIDAERLADLFTVMRAVQLSGATVNVPILAGRGRYYGHKCITN